jgi:hypothetical protein
MQLTIPTKAGICSAKQSGGNILLNRRRLGLSQLPELTFQKVEM